MTREEAKKRIDGLSDDVFRVLVMFLDVMDPQRKNNGDPDARPGGYAEGGEETDQI